MKIEIRNDHVVLDGYVNVVERESRELNSNRGKFIEIIKAKTFEKALAKNEDVKMLFNHNESRELGSVGDGSLELYEDNIGLRAIATITDSEVIRKAKNNELRGWSFGFKAIKDTWESSDSGVSKRYLEDIELLEVSILDVTPAYVGTSVEVRAESGEAVVENRSEEFKARISNANDSVDYDKIAGMISSSLRDAGLVHDEPEVRTFDYKVYEMELELLKLKK